jgi:hypothetical protein
VRSYFTAGSFLESRAVVYPTRSDTFSMTAHYARFDGFAGEKLDLTTRRAIAER